jgi:predicted nucleotidyltransferase component of viral defense system
MIPLGAITAWSNKVPWINPHFVEQDLLLCRVLTELYNDGPLSSKLAFRGGTAIHKLYLCPQPRFSEDIDLVQVTPEPIGKVLNRIREVFSFLGVPNIKQKQSNNTIVFRYYSESLPITNLRIKIEINCQEHLNVRGLALVPFEVQNPWFTGNCSIVTFTIDELIGTKFRALYQRKKGRDLFDIYSKGIVTKAPRFKEKPATMLCNCKKETASSYMARLRRCWLFGGE